MATKTTAGFTEPNGSPKQKQPFAIPGVYGWHDDRLLHKVHRSDSRGILVPNTDFSTADAKGVRTELHLGDLESAIVEKIPIQVLMERPMNVLVKQYDTTAIQLQISGKANLRLILKTGDFPIEAGQRYLIQTDQSTPVEWTAAPTLAVPINIARETTIRITPAVRTGRPSSN